MKMIKLVLKGLAGFIYLLLKLAGLFMLMIWFFLSALPDVMKACDARIADGYNQFVLIPNIMVPTALIWFFILCYKVLSPFVRSSSNKEVENG